MLSTVKAAILRIADGRAVRQIPIDPSTQPLLARARDGLWITSADALLRHNRITRIDPDTGNITGMLDLGRQRPNALVATDDALCVVTAEGKILLIRS